MTPELTVLCLTALLQAVQILLVTVTLVQSGHTAYGLSPRDRDPSTPLSDMTGRLRRTVQNGFEALTLFAPAALIIGLTDQSTPTTTFLAYAFLASRVLFLPAYAFGWAPGRTLIWGIGFVATLGLYLVALL